MTDAPPPAAACAPAARPPAGRPPAGRPPAGRPAAASRAAPRAPALAIEKLPILVAPHRTLKLRCRPVAAADDAAVRDLVARMFATMYHAPGIGLAAPQVGVALRLAVIDLAPDDKRTPHVLINPEIVAVSKELATREEGCLSLPNMYADVTRPAQVKVRYLDIDGARREIQGDGLLAACLQHELDHLDGVLFVDHLSALKRNMILRKLAKDQKAKEQTAGDR
ncbi:MAG: peptide deformylase [Acetobacteraceae bacterium]|nr:peptide deformylase [Acetobacteraceae bacterium]